MEQRGRKIKHVKDVFKDSKKATRPRELRYSSSSQGSPRVPRSPAGDPRRQLPDLPMHSAVDVSPIDPSPSIFDDSPRVEHASPPTESSSPLTGCDSPATRKGVPSVPLHRFGESERRAIVTQQSSPPTFGSQISAHSGDSISPLVSPAAVTPRYVIGKSEQREQREEREDGPTLVRSLRRYADDDDDVRSVRSKRQTARSMKAGSTGTAGSTGSEASLPDDRIAVEQYPGSEASLPDDRIAVEQYPGSEHFSQFLDDDEEDDQRLRSAKSSRSSHSRSTHTSHSHSHTSHSRSSHSHSHTSSANREEPVSALGKLFGRLLRRSSSIGAEKSRLRSIYNTTYLDSKLGRAEDRDDKSFDAMTMRARRQHWYLPTPVVYYPHAHTLFLYLDCYQFQDLFIYRDCRAF